MCQLSKNQAVGEATLITFEHSKKLLAEFTLNPSYKIWLHANLSEISYSFSIGNIVGT